MHLPRLEPDVSGLSDDDARRVRLTVACGDCDALPKVAGAGEVVERDGHRVQVMHNGVLVEAGGYFGDWMSEIIRCLRGHHEPQEELVFARVLERLARTRTAPPVAVELGAFWAYYSLWLLQEQPDAHVVALEPDLGNLELGRRNFALNGRQGRFVHGVMGEQPGRSTDFTNLDGSTSSVRQYDLAGLFEECGLERVNLLLCDVQGAERFLFGQAADLLRAGVVRFAVVSTHHHTISGDPLTHRQVLDELRGLGAHVVAEHTVHESCSGDGLVVVSFDAADTDLHVDTSRLRGESLFAPLDVDLDRALRWARHAEAERDAARIERDAARGRAAALQAELQRGPEGAAPPVSDDGAQHEAADAALVPREALEDAERELARARAELAHVRSTRLWRWSRPARAAYARLRSRGRGPR